MSDDLIARAEAVMNAYHNSGAPDRPLRSVECALLLPELLAEVKRLRVAVQRVRELHREETFDSVPSRCHHCWTDYPCPTVRALVGEDL